MPPSDLDALRAVARARMTQLGVKKVSGSMIRGPKQPQATPRTPAAKVDPHRVFRRPLRDLSMVMASDPEGVLVPKFLSALCEFLRASPDRLDTEGIFRRSGSSARQRSLRHLMASVIDVAGLLKQWLRELPEPIVPLQLQKLMLE